MNNIIKSVIIIAVACCSCACNKMDWDILEEHPKAISQETFMTNASEVESQINSIYYQLKRNEGFSKHLSVLGEAGSDLVWGRGNFTYSNATGLSSGGASFATDTWAVLYRSIRYSNQIIEAMPKAKLSEKEFNELSGEVRFLRAFAYSMLVKYWGGVPFFDENNQNDMIKPRTEASVLWDYIIKEAQYAAANLPATTKTWGRPTKYSADALLCEACLWRERWQDAADAAGAIINSGLYSLVPVSTPTDFNNLFEERANGTSEEVFYLKYSHDYPNIIIWLYLTDGGNSILPRTSGASAAYTDYVRNKTIASWDSNDFRYKYDLTACPKSKTLTALTPHPMYCSKFRDYKEEELKLAGNVNGQDYPMYRYADVLLYYAEAVARAKGAPTADAMEKVNMIRRRAYGQNINTANSIDYKLADYSSLNQFIDLVLKERGYETIWEGKRYTDLKRCGVLAEYYVRSGKAESVNDVGAAAWYWPIPDQEFSYNTLLDPETDQNPGY